MSEWAAEDLATLAAGDEIRIASYRPDGSLRPYVRIWFVAMDGELYVRSAYGPDNGWYRRARASGIGRLKTRNLERDVAFEAPGPDVTEALHAAYHAKYDRYGARIVGTVVSDEAAACTLRLVPG